MEPLSRPVPTRSVAERARAWLEWFGVARLVATTIATIVVCAGGVWLVRTPPPASELGLPRVTTTTSSLPLAAAELATTAPGSNTVPPATVTVHVAGAVVAPGVYELAGGARVHDAVVAAGGTTDAADGDLLNLAAVVADGGKVYVPRVGEEVPPAAGEPAAAAGTSPAGPIDVNVATADELDALPGIGPATATAIVVERERNGPFLVVDDLDRVPGIGPAKLAALRELVTT